MPPLVEVGHDGLDPPVPVPVDDVAPIAGLEELRVESRVVGPRPRVRSDADVFR
jgi:hypothetical protein